MEIKNTVKNNLFFKVDFDGKYKKQKGKIVQDVSFFLIGVLPVVVIYKDGERERAIINTPLKVNSDPHLRLMHGVRYKFISKVQKEIKQKFNISVNYKKLADVIVEKATGAINKIGESGKFREREISSILILNTEK